MEGRDSGRGWRRLDVLVILAASGAVLAAGCHTITEEAPTQPSPVNEVVKPITIPVIMPTNSTPSPTPTSTPKPDPDPKPTPKPTPKPDPTPEPDPDPPASGSCKLPSSKPKNPVCSLNPPLFAGEVDEAITRVTEKKPGLFDFGNKKCGNCYYVKNVNSYVNQVMKELGNMGLCTKWDGEEVAVKKTNNRSEQYDIILASGHIRRGAGSYRGDCKPSWF